MTATATRTTWRWESAAHANEHSLKASITALETKETDGSDLAAVA